MCKYNLYFIVKFGKSPWSIHKKSPNLVEFSALTTWALHVKIGPYFLNTGKYNDEEKYLGNAAKVSRGQWKPGVCGLGNNTFQQ